MLGSAKHKLLDLTGLSEDEFRRVWPIGAAYAAIMASLYVLKPARNALFLSVVGASYLPYVLILVACVGGVTALAFSRVTQAVPLGKLILWVLPILGLCTASFRWLLDAPQPAIVFAFYAWVNLYGHLTTALLWLLANAVFDAREARRAFGFVGALGIAGAVIGGLLTQLLSAIVGTLDLLWLTVVLQMAAFVSLRARTARSEKPRLRSRRNSPGSVSVWLQLRDNSLLRTLALLAAVAATVSAIVDVQFNIAVDARFQTRDEQAEFFGAFFAGLNAASFFFQLVIAPRLLSRFGLAPALMLLPLTLALGATSLLVVPVLASAVLLKSSDVGLRHSLYKSAFELLFVPLPAGVKKKAKLLLDVTVDNLGTGAGALLVLLLMDQWGLAFHWLSVATIGLSAVWIGLAARARTAYLGALRQGLSRREIVPEELFVPLSDAVARRSLIEALGGQTSRQVQYALDMLSGARDEALIQPLLALLQHEDAVVRQRALRLLSCQKVEPRAEQVLPLLEDANAGVRREALYALAVQSGRRQQTIADYLAHSDPRFQSAALGCVAEYLGAAGQGLLTEKVQTRVLGLQGDLGRDARVELAHALGAVGPGVAFSALPELAEDESSEVVSAAILALSVQQDLSRVDWFLSKLQHREYRRAATRALASYGDRILPQLSQALLVPHASELNRSQVARVFVELGTPASGERLLRCVRGLRPAERLPALKAMSKLRRREPLRSYNRQAIRSALREEAEWLTGLLAARAAEQAAGASSDAERLLLKALGERVDDARDRIFRLLAVCYSPADVFVAFLRTRSPDRLEQASAFEFLDNLLAREDKDFVFPFFEPTSASQVLVGLSRLYSVPALPAPGARGWLLTGPDPWLRACALFACGPRIQNESPELLRELLADASDLVRETAVLLAARAIVSEKREAHDFNH